MADTDITSRSGKGAALSATDYDQNLNGLNGSVEEKIANYTVLFTDQGKTIQINGASLTMTMDAIATIIAAIDTTDFKVCLKNIHTSDATIARSSTDTFDGATSITLAENASVILQTNEANTEWLVVGPFTDKPDINGGTIDGATIGATSHTTGKFTTLEATTSIKTALGATITDIDTAMAGSPSDAQLLTAQGIQEYVDDRPAWQFLIGFSTTGSATLGEYTSIPAGAIGLKFLFSGVSGSGTGTIQIELGYGGTPTYSSSSSGAVFSGSTTTFSSGPFRLVQSGFDTSTLFGVVEFMKHNATHTWAGTSQLADVGAADFDDAAGQVHLTGGELTAAKVTITAGTFDAGSASLYALY